jgi:hypothetical protein
MQSRLTFFLRRYPKEGISAESVAPKPRSSVKARARVRENIRVWISRPTINPTRTNEFGRDARQPPRRIPIEGALLQRHVPDRLAATFTLLSQCAGYRASPLPGLQAAPKLDLKMAPPAAFHFRDTLALGL